MSASLQSAAGTQPGLARIAGHVAAISGEVDRLLGIETEGAHTRADKLSQTLAEMRAMASLLAEMRAEVVGLAPPSSDLGDALDAVVSETEGAAFEILRQAERAQAAAGRLNRGETADPSTDLAEVDAAATSIVLACAFQDITGQRVRKVLSTLRQVEARVFVLVQMLGIRPEETQTQSGSRDPRSDAHLLNGPSSAAEGGLGQSAVDDLFG
ncbi:protein phosphatase CheZ [Teichococcus vastitatis]|jgi:chemotaxis regulatin CheY-phosphate phosphatase CheZ|uniref:Protein phosphatase CheZ n=1 Tax=Teichococcus vastitatis TaxID=2307076 RepID=A0ABS9W687_9PROT|nr:protein phosphatase CheZ [Pseudoroseomonas vastitatis]MCI0754799.1 protein phosphatase CheZ [Pseudoroseomonas vastitatis]